MLFGEQKLPLIKRSVEVEGLARRDCRNTGHEEHEDDGEPHTDHLMMTKALGGC
jgi:hypothetical protein